MNKSEKTCNLFAAMARASRDSKFIDRDCVNPFFKSKYADLGSIVKAIKPVLEANGLFFMHVPSGENVECVIVHAESGEWVSGLYALTAIKADPQAMGSAMTYARRYSLCAMLGLVTDEDDDGEAAVRDAKPIVPAKDMAALKAAINKNKPEGVK